jgi:hypothetical protein
MLDRPSVAASQQPSPAASIRPTKQREIRPQESSSVDADAAVASSATTTATTTTTTTTTTDAPDAQPTSGAAESSAKKRQRHVSDSDDSDSDMPPAAPVGEDSTRSRSDTAVERSPAKKRATAPPPLDLSTPERSSGTPDRKPLFDSSPGTPDTLDGAASTTSQDDDGSPDVKSPEQKTYVVERILRHKEPLDDEKGWSFFVEWHG